MTILIAYASKHGSTQGIAERIAEQLRQLGKEAEARSVEEVSDTGLYEAFVMTKGRDYQIGKMLCKKHNFVVSVNI